MRICRFERGGALQFGWIESVSGQETITRALADFPERNAGQAFEGGESCSLRLADANLSVPLKPSKIVCVGRNYREHASELGNEVPAEPLIFLKPPSSLLAPGATIVRPRASSRVDFEGELGVVIGRRCRRLKPDEDVRPYILGYTALNDVTARDLQKSDGQWTRAKGFDSFCPVGPIVSDQPDPWSGVEVRTEVNGELRQKGNTNQFIFPLDVVIRYISQIMTLWPGDLIATGTPQGVAPLKAGDVVEVTIEGIGTLRNPVADEA